MVIPKSVERIQKMRSGEKIKCTKCADGFVSAVGKPENAYLFKCDRCDLNIFITRNPNK